MLGFFINTINHLLPEPQASLLAGMLFGVKRTMPDEFYQMLVVTGTLHVIALSGMNISIIVRVLFDTVGQYLGKRISILLTLTSIVGFIILVGPSASIMRAAIMGLLTIVAAVVGRKDIPLVSLIVTSILMIMVDREIITSISFQLSVFATLGIILFAGSSPSQTNKQNMIETHGIIGHIKTLIILSFKGFMRFCVSNLRVSLSAQIFTTPLILFYFHRVSFISPLANIAISWLVAPITYIGFVMVLLGTIWYPLGRLVAVIIWVPLTLFIWLVKLFSQVPFASIDISAL